MQRLLMPTFISIIAGRAKFSTCSFESDSEALARIGQSGRQVLLNDVTIRRRADGSSSRRAATGRSPVSRWSSTTSRVAAVLCQHYRTVYLRRLKA